MQQVYNRMLWGWGGGLASFAELPPYEVTMESCQISVYVTHKLTLSILQPSAKRPIACFLFTF
jgi:hypothetical protein